jgi:hypothetical protein
MVEFHSNHAVRAVSSADECLFSRGTRRIGTSLVSSQLPLSIDAHDHRIGHINVEIWDRGLSEAYRR